MTKGCNRGLDPRKGGPVTQTTDRPTVAELLSIWGGEPSYRIVPCFVAPTKEDREAGRRLLRSILGDLAEFTVDRRDEGVERLRKMASSEPRCADFASAADMLAEMPADHLLMLGWHLQ